MGIINGWNIHGTSSTATTAAMIVATDSGGDCANGTAVTTAMIIGMFITSIYCGHLIVKLHYEWVYIYRRFAFLFSNA